MYPSCRTRRSCPRPGPEGRQNRRCWQAGPRPGRARRHHYVQHVHGEVRKRLLARPRQVTMSEAGTDPSPGVSRRRRGSSRRGAGDVRAGRRAARVRRRTGHRAAGQVGVAAPADDPAAASALAGSRRQRLTTLPKRRWRPAWTPEDSPDCAAPRRGPCRARPAGAAPRRQGRPTAGAARRFPGSAEPVRLSCVRSVDESGPGRHRTDSGSRLRPNSPRPGRHRRPPPRLGLV